jgi:hypothetical protein
MTDNTTEGYYIQLNLSEFWLDSKNKRIILDKEELDNEWWNSEILVHYSKNEMILSAFNLSSFSNYKDAEKIKWGEPVWRSPM